MRFRLLAPWLLLSCTGCVAFSPPAPYHTKQETLFVQGLEELQTNGTAKAFTELESKHPTSPWTKKAALVMGIVQVNEAQLARVKRQQQQEKSRCAKDSEELTREILRLKDDLAKLRHLVIELETRAK